VLVTQVRGLRA